MAPLQLPFPTPSVISPGDGLPGGGTAKARRAPSGDVWLQMTPRSDEGTRGTREDPRAHAFPWSPTRSPTRGGPGAGLQLCPRQPPGGSKSPALRQRCHPPPPSPCTENLVNLWGSAAKRLPCLCAGGQQCALAPCRAFRTPLSPCGDFPRLMNAPETLMGKQGHWRVRSTMLIIFFPLQK